MGKREVVAMSGGKASRAVVRFIVTEIEGYTRLERTHSATHPGISCHVIDTLWNRRLMASYRSEDQPRGTGHDREDARAATRALAAQRAHELEEQCRG